MTGSAPAAEAEPRASGARWLELLVALACAPIFAVAVKSWDVWWHLATGRYIAAQHRIPDTDPFSYTMKGEPWRLVNGVADLVLYGFHAALGVAGLVVAKLVFGALTVLLVGLGARRLGAGAGLRVALMIAVALLLQARLSLARPLILGAALIAAGNLAALRLEEDGDGKDRAPLAFFALSLPIWPLIHGTAIVGLAQLGLVTLVLVMGRGAGARSARRALACLAWVTVVAAAAPFWRDLVAVAVGLGGGVTATTFTAEWQSGVDALGHHLGRWLFVVLGIGGGVMAWRHEREPRRVPLGLALLGLVLAFRYGRNAYEAVLLASPGVVIALVALRERLVSRPLFAVTAAPIALLGLIAIQLATAPLESINGPFGFGVARGRYPDDALAVLRELPEGRVLNDFPTGGYLIWQGIEVYCDGRTVALYREADVQHLFVPLMESSDALTKSADEWHAVYGLAQHAAPPNQWMMVSPEWVPLHLGLNASLFLRRTELGRLPPGVVPLHLLRYSQDLGWTRGWYAGIVRDPALRAQLLTELEAAHRRGESPLYYRILDQIAALDPAYADELAARIGAHSR